MKPNELQNDMKQHFENKSKRKSKVENNPLIEITKEISKRVEGQKDTIQFLTIMNAMSRHTGCKGTSGNVLLRSESGAGKDYIVREIRRPWGLNNNFTHIQKLTKEGITYADTKNNPDFTWDGHVLHLEEVNGSTINNKSMLAFLSNDFGNKFSMKSVRDNKAQDEFVIGKPIIQMTSSTLELDYDNLRRIKVWYLNISDEQIQRAINKEIEIRNNQHKYKINQAVIDYLQELQEIYYDVHIPYAKDLSKSFVKSFSGKLPTQAMSVFSFVLDFIGAVTILHHKVRVKDEHDRLVATPEDFEIAKPILAELFKKGIIPTLPQEEDMIEVLGNPNTNLCYHCNELSCGNPNIHTIAEIRKELEYDVVYTTAQIRLQNLMKKGLVTKHGSARCNSNNRKTTGYSLNGFSGFQQLALSIVKENNENITKIEKNQNNKKIKNTQKTHDQPLVSIFSSFSLVSLFSQLSDNAKPYVNIIQDEFSNKEFDSADLLTKYSDLSQKDVNDIMEYFANNELIIEAGQGRFVFI